MRSLGLGKEVRLVPWIEEEDPTNGGLSAISFCSASAATAEEVAVIMRPDQTSDVVNQEQISSLLSDHFVTKYLACVRHCFEVNDSEVQRFACLLSLGRN